MSSVTYVLSIVVMLAVAAVLAGCSPELAQAPLGPKEEKWSAFIQKHYPGWEAPQTTPPITNGDNENTPKKTMKDDVYKLACTPIFFSR